MVLCTQVSAACAFGKTCESKTFVNIVWRSLSQRFEQLRICATGSCQLSCSRFDDSLDLGRSAGRSGRTSQLETTDACSPEDARHRRRYRSIGLRRNCRPSLRPTRDHSPPRPLLPASHCSLRAARRFWLPPTGTHSEWSGEPRSRVKLKRPDCRSPTLTQRAASSLQESFLYCSGEQVQVPHS